MATKGLCGYCERPADSTCQTCGRAICEEHTDHDEVCTSCAQGTMAGANR
jgi:hypothetical protein